MYQRKITIASMLMSALLVLGCSSSSDNSGSTSEQGPGGDNGGSVNTAFNGNWTRACDEDFEVSNVSVNGTTASVETYSYLDAACTLPDVPAVTNATLSLAFPGGTTNTAQGVATHVNTTVEDVTYDGAPPTAEQLAVLQQFGVFDVEYDIVLLSGSTLYFGEFTDDLDGTTAAKRPTTLDQIFTLTRQ